MGIESPDTVMFKMALIGDASVGKTSLRRKFLGQGFIHSHIATIGVDFAQKYVSVDGKTIRLVIWDLAGQQSYESVRKHYYQGCSSLILVFSVVDRESFDNASRWLVEAFKYMGNLPPTAILGNKIDLREKDPEGGVTAQEGFHFAELFKEKLQVPAFYNETCALTGENVEETFLELSRMMIREHEARLKPQS